MSVAEDPVARLDDEFLLKAADLSRRLRKYLFLPIMIVGTLVSPQGFLALTGESVENSVYAKSIIPVTAVSYLLWWLSRNPRRTLFLFQGLFLGVVGPLFASWIIFVLWWGEELDVPIPKPLLIIQAVTFGAVVPLLVWKTGMKCLDVWHALKGISQSEFRAAFEAARERATLRETDLSNAQGSEKDA